MKTKIIEATDATEFNWGKFLVGQFDVEWEVPSAISGRKSLLVERGWHKKNILVLDLEAREGAVFMPGGLAAADLATHKVYVCPMFEPFLEWLYKQDLSDIDNLPSCVNLGKVPTAMYGYRRPGIDK